MKLLSLTGFVAVLLGAATALALPLGLTVRALDERGLAQSSASLSRTMPAELGGLGGPDLDALHFLLLGPPDSLLEPIEALTFGADGRPRDVIVKLGTEPATCPDGVSPELVCRVTPPLRLVTDALERYHPALKRRSLRAELGGSLRLSASGKTLIELPVTAPRREDGKVLPLLQASLRVFVLRSRPGGEPAIGGDEAGARARMEQELGVAAGLWGQCGISLGRPERTTFKVVDPPRGQLLALGCGLGQPAAGGRIRLQRGNKRIEVVTHPGESPASAAGRLALALGGAKPPPVFENARASGEAVPSADVWLNVEPVRALENAPLSSDPTLPLCLGEVDFDDGLAHFSDSDAFVGTVEERALLRAFDDGDASTVELLVVPRFDSGERIGESFIVSTGSSLSSSVVIDRGAVSAGARSFALAHELGHVFLAMPGHPDDFSVDQSWSLMDSDVADATIFGPRRLSLPDCERAVVQAGPSALVPVLKAAQ